MVISGEEFRDAREIVAEMTQREVAELIGVSLRTVGNWEREGVPEKRERRVMAKFGTYLQSLRSGREVMADLDAWSETPEGKAQLEQEGVLRQGDVEIAEDPFGYYLSHAPDEMLLDELRSRLARAAPAATVTELRPSVSEDLEILVANDEDPREEQDGSADGR